MTLTQPTVHQPNNRPTNARTFASKHSSVVPRDTGFSEPLSRLTNTTLSHKDALTGPGEELDVRVITDGEHRRHPTLPGWRNHNYSGERIEAEMYNDLNVVDAEDHKKIHREGNFKKILHKLPCTH